MTVHFLDGDDVQKRKVETLPAEQRHHICTRHVCFLQVTSKIYSIPVGMTEWRWVQGSCICVSPIGVMVYHECIHSMVSDQDTVKISYSATYCE